MKTSEFDTKPVIIIETMVNADVETVWKAWTAPEHITQWCHATDDWHAPFAENDLRKGGKFKTTMAARDGSFSFDFGGTYSAVDHHKLIEYVIDDGRNVSVAFEMLRDRTVKVTERFDAEASNPLEMQRAGWQAILDNFKKYAESL